MEENECFLYQEKWTNKCLNVQMKPSTHVLQTHRHIHTHYSRYWAAAPSTSVSSSSSAVFKQLWCVYELMINSAYWMTERSFIIIVSDWRACIKDCLWPLHDLQLSQLFRGCLSVVEECQAVLRSVGRNTYHFLNGSQHLTSCSETTGSWLYVKVKCYHMYLQPWKQRNCPFYVFWFLLWGHIHINYFQLHVWFFKCIYFSWLFPLFVSLNLMVLYETTFVHTHTHLSFSSQKWCSHLSVWLQ